MSERNRMTHETGGQDLPPIDPSTMVCGCFDLTVAGLQSFLRANPDVRFEEMMTATKAGTKCTACTLDLEYHYVTAPRPRPAPGIAGRAPVGGWEPARTAKQIIYDVLDRSSPDVVQSLTNVMPVLTGSGLEEFVCVDNHSLLYEGEICAPEMEIELEIRDDLGRLRHRHDEILGQNSALRVGVSRHLDRPKNGSLGIGSVTITRRALRPGFRGTTRPQIEIMAPSAACCLHSQAATRKKEAWFSCLSRPDDERMFLTLVNAGDRDLSIDIQYPCQDDLPRRASPDSHVIAIPPRGAHLHEIVLRPDHAERLGDRPFHVRWRADGVYKVHAVCATPSLDRFSIDHL